MEVKELLKEELLKLVEIPSESFEERELADYLLKRLEDLGAEEVTEDDECRKRINGSAGNVVAKFKGNGNGPVLLSAHMDTVKPGKNVKPVVEGEIIRSDGTTILGADDKSGIAIILTLLQTLPPEERPDIEVVFDPCEEVGLLGVKNLDPSLISSKVGFVIDDEDPEGIVVKSKTYYRFDLTVKGKEAHSGVEPEKGASAVKLLASILNELPVGRLSEKTTANVGTISGGCARNVVPPTATASGEVRSFSIQEIEEYLSALNKLVESKVKLFRMSLPEDLKGSVSWNLNVNREFKGYTHSKNDPIIRAMQRAAKNLGFQLKLKSSGGGTNANVFGEKGVKCYVVGTGMKNVHTKEEHISLEDMEKSYSLLKEVLMAISQTP